MASYKRNQVEEAIAATLGRSDDEDTSELRVRIKRLLDTDRALGRDLRATDPERAAYAFYSSDAPGSGLEVWFSGYEVFALLAALLLLQHGWPQGTVVRIMRQARPTLEPQHKRVLSQDPKELFNQAEVLRRAAPGMIAVDNTDPVFLAIVTAGGAEKARADAETGPIAVSACRGQEALMTFMRQEAPVGMSATFIELVGQAHRLAQHLAQTKPRARGRGSR